MTIQESIKKVISQLKTIYEDGEASAMTDWILEYVMMKTKKEKVLARTAVLNPAQVNEIEAIIQRLLKQEPLQYILQEAWFNGIKFYVDKNVLIPRPETEELVDWVLTDNARLPLKQIRILDIGSGSGCIPVSLKMKLPGADVWSCEVSHEALEVARRNAANQHVEIHFNEMDFLNRYNWQRFPVFDIIISNPPYVTSGEKDLMSLNVLEHEPPQALFVPENDPLVFYDAIAEFGQTHLAKDGKMYCEINQQLAKETMDLFISRGYKTELKKDMQGKYRMIKLTLEH